MFTCCAHIIEKGNANKIHFNAQEDMISSIGSHVVYRAPSLRIVPQKNCDRRRIVAYLIIFVIFKGIYIYIYICFFI